MRKLIVQVAGAHPNLLLGYAPQFDIHAENAQAMPWYLPLHKLNDSNQCL